MTTALYPATIYPLIGYGAPEPIFYTQTTPMKSGTDVAEKLWNTPRYRISIPYRVSSADASTILNFFEARYGMYEEFDFIDFHTRSWVKVSIGTGDGLEDEYELPCTGAASLVIYVDDEAVEAYTNSSGTGTNSRDVITFAPAAVPGNGESVTASFIGKRYFSTKFAQDQIRPRTVALYASNREYLEFDVELISQRT